MRTILTAALAAFLFAGAGFLIFFVAAAWLLCYLLWRRLRSSSRPRAATDLPYQVPCMFCG